MSAWEVWLLIGGMLVIAELCTGTFYLLMVAFGMAAGALAAAVGLRVEWQLLAAAIVAVASIAVLRRTRFAFPTKANAARDRNVNLDIGEAIQIDRWHIHSDAPDVADGSLSYTARVKYRGALWDVELAPGETAQRGQFSIREIRGSRLIVIAHRTPKNH
jgi:membrane protein implicated in regulation of membrane protease activity